MHAIPNEIRDLNLNVFLFILFKMNLKIVRLIILNKKAMKTKCELAIETVMKKWKKFFSLVVLVLICPVVSAQSNDSMFYRHSLQFNMAGLGFERYGIAYEYRMTPRHALFVQGGGSFPGISEEKEYGFGLHYKYILQPVKNARFLWLFKSAFRNTFLDLNARYMNLDGFHNDTQYLYESFFIGAGAGQTWVWNSGFTISYWLGYGPPIGAEYKWKNTAPEDEESWAKTYKWASGLDFGLSLGYSFGSFKK